jgi:hypothetical protein
LASGDFESIPNFGKEVQKRKPTEILTGEQKTVFNFLSHYKTNVMEQKDPNTMQNNNL